MSENNSTLSHNRKVDLIGISFGRLTVVSKTSGPKGRLWVCKCACGNEHTTNTSFLLKGSVKSCGCLRKEMCRANQPNRKHGMANSAEYKTWQRIKDRCRNRNSPDFKSYGAKGVNVCQRWLDSFEVFYEDLGPKPSNKHSIDRYPDKNGPYSPDNCRWATIKEQARNKNSNKILVLNGKSRCIAEWSEITGIRREIIESRSRRGWSDKRTLTTPPRNINDPDHISICLRS
jgi:hypothetical protein